MAVLDLIKYRSAEGKAKSEQVLASKVRKSSEDDGRQNADWRNDRVCIRQDDEWTMESDTQRNRDRGLGKMEKKAPELGDGSCSEEEGAEGEREA